MVGTDLELDLSWYFSDQLGVGVEYAAKDRGDAGDIDYHKVWANYFPSDKWSVELSYFSEDHDGRNLESDGILLEAKYRI